MHVEVKLAVGVQETIFECLGCGLFFFFWI